MMAITTSNSMRVKFLLGFCIVNLPVGGVVVILFIEIIIQEKSVYNNRVFC
jgi:hypothetical protein